VPFATTCTYVNCVVDILSHCLQPEIYLNMSLVVVPNYQLRLMCSHCVSYSVCLICLYVVAYVIHTCMYSNVESWINVRN